MSTAHLNFKTLNLSVCFNVPCPAVLRGCFWWNHLINSQSQWGPCHFKSWANMNHINMINKRTPWSKRGQLLHQDIKNLTVACQQLNWVKCSMKTIEKVRMRSRGIISKFVDAGFLFFQMRESCIPRRNIRVLVDLSEKEY